MVDSTASCDRWGRVSEVQIYVSGRETVWSEVCMEIEKVGQ